MSEKIRNRIQVGYTDKELAKLKLEFSKTNFQSFSKFLNYKTTNRFFMTNEKNFAKLFAELSKIGNNINQISKRLNDVTVVNKDLDFAPFDELKKLISEMWEFQLFILDEKK